MDEMTLVEVQRRLASATAGLPQLPSTSNVVALSNLRELLASLEVAAAHRCNECKSQLLCGPNSRICIACGQAQSGKDVPSSEFSFKTSLALRLFLESLRPIDASPRSDISSRMVVTAGSREDTRVGTHGNSFGDQTLVSGNVKVSGINDTNLEEFAAEFGSNFYLQEDEDDIWQNTAGDDGVSILWTKQISGQAGVPGSSGDDFFSEPVLPPQNSLALGALVSSEGSGTFGSGVSIMPTVLSNDFFESEPNEQFAFGVKSQQGNPRDFFSQLEGLQPSHSQTRDGTVEKASRFVKSLLAELPDLSFMLADHLVIPSTNKQPGASPLMV